MRFAEKGIPFRQRPGGKTHKVTVPKHMPMGQFCSLIVYDEATYVFIYNPIGPVRAESTGY